MRTLLFIFSFFLLCRSVSGQNTPQVDSLKKLGRDSLIKLAIKEVNDPAFDPTAYDRVVVKADSTSVIVSFSLSVNLISPRACYYDAVNIALVGNGTSKSITGFCDEPKFYKPSAKQKKKINFVFESINKKNEIGDIPNKKLGWSSRMEIKERTTYYYVEMRSSSSFSHYKIKKGSGKIYDAGHKHYARYGEKKDRYEIIK